MGGSCLGTLALEQLGQGLRGGQREAGPWSHSHGGWGVQWLGGGGDLPDDWVASSLGRAAVW